MSSYDAIVVGARPAGAATALLLARRGLRVLVVDQQREGRDTLSTHAVMRAGVVRTIGPVAPSLRLLVRGRLPSGPSGRAHGRAVARVATHVPTARPLDRSRDRIPPGVTRSLVIL